VDDARTLSRSVAAIRALFGAAASSVALVDPDGATLRFVASDGAGADAIVGVQLPVGRGIAGWAVMSGQPIAVRDVASDSRFARDVAEATEYVPTVILAAPMFDEDGEALGVLSVLDPTVDAAADWTLAVCGTLAAQVALLVPGTAGGAVDGGLTELARHVLAAVDEYRR
jgi:signal transduction protein with GAF and PtsI domain